MARRLSSAGVGQRIHRHREPNCTGVALLPRPIPSGRVMENLVLAARDVSVEFSGLRALDGVSLSLSQGEILGLIGPNGSGKTTLVNAITGHVPLASGRITLGDVDVTGRLPRQVALAGVARSFQIVRLFENLTVLENIATPPLSHGFGRAEARRTASDLLAEFGLSERADDLAMALS
jgi:branched-chain amino acid transport system ATP-binding protein